MLMAASIVSNFSKSAEKRDIVRDFINKWNKSFFVISYNFHSISDRDIFYLRKFVFDNSHFTIKVFKNNLVKKGLLDIFEDNISLVNSLKINGSSILFFCFFHEEKKIDIFEALSLFKRFGESKLGESNINRFNWAFFGGEFRSSSILSEWSFLPSRKEMFYKLTKILGYNIIILVKCIEEIIIKKRNY